MPEPTVLEALEEAVKTYVRAVSGETVVSGWVLGVQTTSITDREDVLPLVFASEYAMGTSTSPEAAIGLLRLTEARLTHTIVSYED